MKTLQSFPIPTYATIRRTPRRPDTDATVFILTSLLFILAVFVAG